MSPSTPLFRKTFAGIVLAAALLSACGSSGSSAQGAKSDATTIAGETQASESHSSDSGVAITDELCDSIPADTFVESAESTITAAKFIPGTGSYQGVKYDSASCAFALEDGTEITFSQLLKPDSDTPMGADDYTAIHDASAGRSGRMSDYPHSEVDGLGDSAAMLDSMMHAKLLVLADGKVFIVNVEDDEEALGIDTVRQIASSGFTAVG